MTFYLFIGIPRITGTMDEFDSYPAVFFAFTAGFNHKYALIDKLESKV